MAEVEPEVVETVETIEPEPEPEPEEKKKRKKRDDAPARAPRVRRVAKPRVVREELPPAPEVDAIFLCNSERTCDPSKKNLDSAASRASRLYKKLCRIVKRNARSRTINHHDAQAAGDDAAVDRASTPVFGECLRPPPSS